MNRPHQLSGVHFLIGSLVFWLLLTTLNLLQNYIAAASAEQTFAWKGRLIYYLAYNGGFFALSYPFFAVLRWLNSRFKLGFLRSSTLSICVFSQLHVVIFFTVMGSFYDRMWEGKNNYGEFLWGELAYNWYFAIGSALFFGLMASAIFAADTWLDWRNQKQVNAEISEQLKAAELGVLKERLRPHFLFNALNTISMLTAQEKPEKVMEFVSGLGDLLRLSLNSPAENLIPLRSEIEMIESYLNIQQTRFGDRIRILMNIDEATSDVLVPPFILQPLVENAYKHGFENHLGDGQLSVRAFTDDAKTDIVVYNSGPPFSQNNRQDQNREGGLEITHRRLKLLFGDGASFSITNKNEGVEATITIQKVPDD